jgi:hypothetical protein
MPSATISGAGARGRKAGGREPCEWVGGAKPRLSSTARKTLMGR